MKTTAGLILAIVVSLGIGLASRTEAGPSLPVTKPPVQPLAQMTGPPVDPFAVQGQWFINATGGETVRTNEFHDDLYGGFSGVQAIAGYVDSITYLGGVPGGPIVAFSIQATVLNDTSTVMDWLGGSNQHGETLTYQDTPYLGPLVDAKLVAEFAIADTNTLPAVFTLPPYRDCQPYIVATNEDQWAWYCWNPLDEDPEHNPKGAYFVPTWDFGTIPMGSMATRQLQFIVPAGLPPVGDSRYAAIVSSFSTSNDILQNRSLSLKISTWIDEIALDSGGNEEPPLRYSDVSVFHNQGEAEPTLDFGDAPDGPYPTRLANDGARHTLVPGVFMGALIDAENDGQPDATATGDDKANLDDEDGVAFPTPLVAGQTATVQVTVSTAGYVSAWIDYNADGSWTNSGEQILSVQAVAMGTNQFAIGVPASAATTNTFARFRFTTLQTIISYTGLVSNGEVEDYEVAIYSEGAELLDFGDAWDSPVIAGYPTLLAHNGARHTVMPGIFLGARVDLEPDGQPTFGADGDDLNPPAGIDDEDGVVLPSVLVAGSTVPAQVTASAPGFLNAWIDFNCDSDWADPGEQVFFNQPVGAGLNILPLPIPPYPITVSGGPHSRWRFTTYAPILPADTGQELDGEVEDHEVRLEVLDFGDAPDPSYPTLLASDGARHRLPSAYWLGPNAPDLDPDGQPTTDATGDDATGTDDEDGVTVSGVLMQGARGTVDVVASTSGYLNAWYDFNDNGAWSDAGEQIATNLALFMGTNVVGVDVPLTARVGPGFARFRFNSTGGLTITGLASDGEVEDYRFTIYQSGPSNPASFLITNFTVVASNTISLDWSGESNVTYETQYRTNLVSTATPPWTAWGVYITGPPWTQTDSNTVETTRFYRVVAPYISP